MMQTTSAPPSYAYPPTQNGYQPLTQSEIYAIKKQYLGLLPPPQVIDICLTFEAHAPLHIKSSVWPYDIRAAIAAILSKKAQESQTQTESDPTPAEHEKTLHPAASASQPSSPTLDAAAVPSASKSPPAATQPQPPAPVHYPHQPYYHPSYPHAPYYAPHATYPPYPPPPHMAYPPNLPAQPSLFPSAALTYPPHSPPAQRQAQPQPPPPPLPPNAVDDLPSYEEMIVEALLDCADPEGCAPKDLFSWMAMHYPLQTNFRPSASQALQKAYKRGRLEKGSNGKYRLNESWEGGNTSRRTTRRPQTHTQVVMPGSQATSSAPSPFTHAPLVTHGSQMRPPPPGQPPGYTGYPYGYYYQGAPLPASAPVPATSQPSSLTQKQSAENLDQETGEGTDAWEAAQNILKAINFGQLLRMNGDAEDNSGTISTERPPGPSAESFDSQSMSRVHAVGEPGPQVELTGNQRAALQAQLALLAAQLVELADISEEEYSHGLEGVQGKERVAATSVPEGARSRESTENDDDDMDMVEVPMSSLTA
ncbi:hypothetical protein EDC04DRAFT_2686040 [Pisolithus marmoratus]|nr:hypothetical protein EDC04DRAFT_2686040 [Pisolithus marmoratus]